MRILVLSSGYPSPSNQYNCTWAHTRSIYYAANGIIVNATTPEIEEPYEIDQVPVIPPKVAIKYHHAKPYDLVISHQPNLRWHLPFLKNFRTTPLLLFMHGSESMWINHDYPKPYDFMQEGFAKRTIRDAYDFLKFRALTKFLNSNHERIKIIFVSNWMRNIFEKNLPKVDLAKIPNQVINNSLNPAFFDTKYTPPTNPVADFVTLRRLDYSKFAIDLVCKLATTNPDKTFHVYGKGNYFKFNKQPRNLRVFEQHIKASEIPNLLSKYRYALMPTRCDAQGVMACEMAAFGIPLITTNIDVSKEMFGGVQNATLLDFEDFEKSFNHKPSDNTKKTINARERFSVENTLQRELLIIRSST